MTKSADAFRTISEVADDLGIPKHVLRFWEVKFSQIRPMKRGGGRRYYRPEDMELLKGIRHLLHREGYTIKGVQKILREQGVDAVKQHAVPAPAEGFAGPARSNDPAVGADATGPRPAQPSAPPSRPQAGAARWAKPAVAAGSNAGTELPVGRSAKPAPAAGSGRTTAAVIAAAIVELERCRALLKDEAAVQAARPRRRADGKR